MSCIMETSKPGSKGTLQYESLLPNKRKTPNEIIKYTLTI